jgi:1-deoxy-D-xylulose-5-phosphate synthase
LFLFEYGAPIPSIKFAEVIILSILEEIHSPADVKALSSDQLDGLCGEIREFLIHSVSQTGGHLSSNLGVVELTVAVHRVFDTSKDRLVFDVGHQSYIHKMLTGRMDQFHTLRKLDGLSGFPNPRESRHDAFIAGHASNSISVGLGMARARTAERGNYHVITLIGDGALSGGLAYEGLSNAGQSGEPMIVILNDNGMSINKSVGGLSTPLSKMRVRPAYFRFKSVYRSIMKHLPALYRLFHKFKKRIKGLLLLSTFFEDLGYYYIGPVDGHDVQQMETVLRWAKRLHEPVLIHAITQKGKGYCVAEYDPEAFHGVGAFDPDTGELPASADNFSKQFGRTLTELAQKDERILAITAAMESGTGLHGFAQTFPDRFFDVGIAEGHAVAMAAGMAKQGMVPVMAVYSTFLQRAYDMLIHDVSLQRLHVVFTVDRAGLVGRDGETHHGLFDVDYLCSIPGMVLFCPSSFAELQTMLYMAIYSVKGPVAIRYPRGGEGVFQENTADHTAVFLQEGTDVTLVTYGVMVNEVLSAAKLLQAGGVSAQVLKLNCINPLDITLIQHGLEKTGCFVMVEEVCAHGCVGERILSTLAEQGNVPQKAKLLNLGNGIVTHGDVKELRARTGIDAQGIRNAVQELLRNSEGI